MKKSTLGKLALVLSIVLMATIVLAACDSPEPRVPTKYFFNPGGPFATNVNDEDPRRQVRCSIVFEVIDEAAIEELNEITFIVRNSVIAVLGELTIPEITTERNQPDIIERIVEQVNFDINSHIDLIVGAYFTDFALA